MKSYHYPLLKKSDLGKYRTQLEKDMGKQPLELFDSLVPLLKEGSNSLKEIYDQLNTKGFTTHAVFTVFKWLEDNSLLKEDPNSILKRIREADMSSGHQKMTEEEIDFYKFQIVLLSRLAGESDNVAFDPLRIGIEYQLRLRDATIIVVGEGDAYLSLLHLAALSGIGRIFGCDLGTEDIKDKAKNKNKIANFNPFIQFTMIDRLEELNDLAKILGSPPNLIVYCSDFFDNRLCSRINQISLLNRVPNLIYKSRPWMAEVGPLVIPFETACYTCYELRRAAAVSYGENQDNQDSLPTRPTFPVGLDFLMLEIMKYLTQVIQPPTQGALVQLDFSNGSMGVHNILKLPRCPSCGKHKVKPSRKLWQEF